VDKIEIGKGPESKDKPIEKFYKSSEGYTQMLQQHDVEYFSTYIAKIERHMPRGRKILDLGCGTGLSSKLLAAHGYNVIGADLSKKFLDANYLGEGVELIAADAANLPLSDSSVDAVTSYCFLEHIPDVPRVLSEMVRVVRPGGTVIVLSPNLLSPFLIIKSMGALLRGKIISGAFPPTFWGHFSALIGSLSVMARKGISLRPTFLYRTPDLTKPALADADSIYRCNQVDLYRYFSMMGMSVRYAGEGYTALGRLIAKVFPGLCGECCVVAERQL